MLSAETLTVGRRACRAAGVLVAGLAFLATNAARAQAPDTTPPRITSLTPAPGQFVVSDTGLTQVKIGFSEPVTLVPESFTVTTIDAGFVSDWTQSYDATLRQATITFNTPRRNTRVTVIARYATADLAGNPLDGEIANPLNASLPSGDGLPGGEGVFRINVLQGDADRNGIVNQTDLDLVTAAQGTHTGQPGYDPRFDFNADGVIDPLDLATAHSNLGGCLTNDDGVPPTVAIISPDPASDLAGDIAQVLVTFSEPMNRSLVCAPVMYGITPAGGLRVANDFDLSLDRRVATFIFNPPLPRCEQYTLNFSNSLQDREGTIFVPPAVKPQLTGMRPPTPVSLNAFSTLTNATSITLAGSVTRAVTVEAVGPGGVVTAPVVNGQFSLAVPLGLNRANMLYVTGISGCGQRGSPVIASVTQDAQGPSLFIDFPSNNAQPTDPATDVTGRVSDTLSGYRGLTVNVNGVPAEVNVGIGTNGTFFAHNVPLPNVGSDTTLLATATDQVGNVTTKQIVVRRQAISGPHLEIVGGNGQVAGVHVVLPAQIAARLLDAANQPLPNRAVTFAVERNDGRLGTSSTTATLQSLQVNTDAQGIARAFWKLGGSSGMGNNRVSASAAGAAGPVQFCASANPGPASQINIGSGNNQACETGGTAPEPLKAWLNDSCNPIANFPVTFTVVTGGGTVNGQTSITLNTDITGHVEATFTAGPDAGNQVVEANFVGNQNGVAAFVTRCIKRDLTKPTVFSGIVLDNASSPLGGVGLRLAVNGTTVGTGTSDSQGQFTFQVANGSAGKSDLFVDGSTATTIAGSPLPADTTFPGLHYEFFIVPNADNSLGMPVLLPPLKNVNARAYSTTADTILTIDGIDGLKFTIKAGSMKLPDGTVAPNGTPVALNQVHHDDVPMPMPDGVAPPFAWTLKPGGATFDPPVAIEYPNMTGLPAGGIAYFLSFNHDTGRFEIVCSGSVNADGSLITSDPGAGLSLAGWGCNCPPYAATSTCESCEQSGLLARVTQSAPGGRRRVIERFSDGHLVETTLDTGRRTTTQVSRSDGKVQWARTRSADGSSEVLEVPRTELRFETRKRSDGGSDVVSTWRDATVVRSYSADGRLIRVAHQTTPSEPAE